MRSVCYAKATYYGMGFPPNFGGVTIFLFAALAPWPVFLQKAVLKRFLSNCRLVEMTYKNLRSSISARTSASQ